MKTLLLLTAALAGIAGHAIATESTTADTPACPDKATALATQTTHRNTAAPELVGTWLFVQANGKLLSHEFYMQICADGSICLWPLASGCSHPEHQIAYGTYEAEGEHFIFHKQHGEPVDSTYVLEDGLLSLSTPKGHTLVYKRVDNPPAPGHLAGRTPAQPETTAPAP